MTHKSTFDVLRASVVEWGSDNPIIVEEFDEKKLAVKSFASTPMIRDWRENLDTLFFTPEYGLVVTD